MRRSMSPAASSGRTLRTSPDSIPRPLRKRPLRHSHPRLRRLQRLRQARAVRRQRSSCSTRGEQCLARGTAARRPSPSTAKK